MSEDCIWPNVNSGASLFAPSRTDMFIIELRASMTSFNFLFLAKEPFVAYSILIML